jgi:hypothetical protein
MRDSSTALGINKNAIDELERKRNVENISGENDEIRMTKLEGS